MNPLSFLTQMIRIAIPYLFAASGGVVAERSGIVSLTLEGFMLGGAFVEYLWMGVLCCLGAWLFCREASSSRLLLWFLGTLSLTVVNGNAWALAAIPIVLMAGRVSLRLPRQTWVFYAFYPAHLLLLLFVRLEWF